MRYPRGRIADDAVSAVSRSTLSVRGPRGLARLWAVEARTLDSRYVGMERVGADHPWLVKAQSFIDACETDGVDPARVVAALFDYARVQTRRGRRWVPSIASAYSEFARRLYAEWENRQRGKADDQPAVRIADARRLAASRRDENETPVAVEKKPVVLRRVPLPRALDARLAETLRRDAETYADYRRQYPRAYAWAPFALAPHSFSPAFRALVDDPDPSIADDPLVRRVLQEPERWREHLAALGVDAELFAEPV